MTANYNIKTILRRTEDIEVDKMFLLWERDKETLQYKIFKPDFFWGEVRKKLNFACRGLLRWAKWRDRDPIDTSCPVEPGELWYEYDGIKFTVEIKRERWDVVLIVSASFKIKDKQYCDWAFSRDDTFYCDINHCDLRCWSK